MENENKEALSDDVKIEKDDRERNVFYMDKVFYSPVIILFGILFYGAIAWYFISSENDLFIKKDPLKENIVKMIGNGANLDSLKNYFNNSEKIEWSFIYGWNNDEKNYYKLPISVVTVFKDIQSDFYLKADSNTIKINRVVELIKEHEQRNPFDELSEIQKDQFNNIRIKLGSNYEAVEQEVNKLSNDMKQNNKLINQYLSDSKTSLYVSISSLIFALITTIGSQLIYRKRSFKK